MTATGSPNTWTPELLEREDEIEQLQALLESAQAGAGRAVLIEAAAGLGKTRLLERIRRRAARLGVHVLTARATEFESELSYGIARQLLEPAILGAADRSEQLLEGAAAGARPALGLSAPGDSAGSETDLSFSTLYGLFWLTANLSEGEPLLLLVDDAHWADTASLRFLSFLAARVEDLPVLLAVAARPATEHHETLANLSLDTDVTRLGPRPLGSKAVAALLESALGQPPAEAFVVACGGLTGGNPFLLAELARTLRADGIDPTTANAPHVRGLLPDSIARAVLGRLAALPPTAGTVARALAVLGDGCETPLVAALAGMEPDAATDATDVLRRADVLDAGGELRFAHPLVRNAVYADIQAGARDREHRRAAALLEERGMSDERIALQLLATEPTGDPKAIATLIAAARAALDRGTADAALACLVRAVREPPPPELRNEIVRLTVEAGFRGGDVLRYADVLVPELSPERVAQLAGDPEILNNSAERIAMALFMLQRTDEGIDLIQKAIAAAEENGDLRRAVTLDALVMLFTQMPGRPAREHFARWTDRLADDTPEQRLSLALHAWWGQLLGEPAEGVADLARRAIDGGRIFEELADTPVAAQSLIVLIRSDDIAEATAAVEPLVEKGIRQSSQSLLLSGLFIRALAAHRSGDLASAEADVRQAVDVMELRSLEHTMPPAPALLIRVLTDRDELEAAEEVLVTSGFDGEIPATNWFEPALFSRGWLRLAQGRTREAVDDFIELRNQIADENGASNVDYPPSAHAARALMLIGEQERAVELAEDELAHARRWGAPSAIAEAQAALGSVTVGDRGIELLKEAVEIAATTPARLVHTRALIDLGIALRRERRPRDAREPLREALQIARRCGAVALAREAATELEAAGERIPRHTPIGADTLTPSERRVSEMAARGMTNREIAAALYVTIKTVESHLHASYDKLGISKRGQLPAALTPAGA